MLTDSLYGSDANVQKATEEGVSFIVPIIGKPKSKESMLILDDFTVDEKNGNMASYPNGEFPYKIRREKDEGLKSISSRRLAKIAITGIIAQWNRIPIIKSNTRPSNCGWLNGGWWSHEFREKYCRCLGIAVVNAILKRMKGMGRLRVRGLDRVCLAVMLKVLG